MEANKRIESSKQRLDEKINEARTYLQREHYDVNELTRLKKRLCKKKEQYEKDFEAYEKLEEKDEGLIELYQSFQIEADDISDDLEHYIEVSRKHEQEKRLEREAEEKRLEREAEEKRLE